MSEANLNPYQSPQGTDDKVKPSDLVEPMTLAELQARVLQLEKQVKSNWFLGPLWKKSLAVVGYFHRLRDAGGRLPYDRARCGGDLDAVRRHR